MKLSVHTKTLAYFLIHEETHKSSENHSETTARYSHLEIQQAMMQRCMACMSITSFNLATSLVFDPLFAEATLANIKLTPPAKHC